MWQVGIDPTPSRDDIVFQIAQQIGGANYTGTDSVQEIERDDGVWMTPLDDKWESEMENKGYVKITACVDGIEYNIEAEMP